MIVRWLCFILFTVDSRYLDFAYLEVKIWSLPPLFHNIFNISPNFKSPITHIFVKCGCSNYFFLNSANLICRGTDILKYFREFLGIRVNDSRLIISFYEQDHAKMCLWPYASSKGPDPGLHKIIWIYQNV